MAQTVDESMTFNALKQVLVPYSKSLAVVAEDEFEYHLDTLHIMKNKKPLFFGAVQIKKNYVSYHLMPVYVNPLLLDDMSDRLKKRMQGKSCFNFKSIDAEVIEELAALTESSYQFYVEAGYVLQCT